MSEYLVDSVVEKFETASEEDQHRMFAYLLMNAADAGLRPFIHAFDDRASDTQKEEVKAFFEDYIDGTMNREED